MGVLSGYLVLCCLVGSSTWLAVTDFSSSRNSFWRLTHSSYCLSLIERRLTSLAISCFPTKSTLSSLAIFSSRLGLRALWFILLTSWTILDTVGSSTWTL